MTLDRAWTVEDYQNLINRAENFKLFHLADALLVLFKKDYPNEVPDHVMSQRGTRLSERSGASEVPTFAEIADNYRQYNRPFTVPEPPLEG